MTGNGVAPAIEVTPPALGFGELRLAQTRDQSFIIRNTGSAPLRVTSIASNNPQFRPIQLLEKPVEHRTQSPTQHSARIKR